MPTFSQATLDFLWELYFNNNKAWFETNKHRCVQHVQAPMKALAQDTFQVVTATSNPHNLRVKVARIYKDARRVRGGDPYKNSLWFFIERPNDDSSSAPGFWFEINRESWSYGLGFWQATPLTMQKLRVRIDRDPQTLEKLLEDVYQHNLFVLSGEDYKRAKVNTHGKLPDWYNKKTLSLVCEQTNFDTVFGEGLAVVLANGYKQLMPLYTYLASLEHDPDPRIQA